MVKPQEEKSFAGRHGIRQKFRHVYINISPARDAHKNLYQPRKYIYIYSVRKRTTRKLQMSRRDSAAQKGRSPRKIYPALRACFNNKVNFRLKIKRWRLIHLEYHRNIQHFRAASDGRKKRYIIHTYVYFIPCLFGTI